MNEPTKYDDAEFKTLIKKISLKCPLTISTIV